MERWERRWSMTVAGDMVCDFSPFGVRELGLRVG